MVLHKGVLPLLGGLVGVQVLQLLGADEGDVGGHAGQHRQLGENGVEEILGVGQGLDDGLHRLLEIGHVPVLPGDDLLPVPLVHIGGVEGVQLLVPADGVHVGVQTLAGLEVIALEGHALPLGQGVDHLGGLFHAVDIKGDRALHAVQVVVQAGLGGDEQGGGHPVQPKGAGQLVREQPLQQADGLLRLIDGQQGAVTLRKRNFTHDEHSFIGLKSPLLYRIGRKIAIAS